MLYQSTDSDGPGMPYDQDVILIDPAEVPIAQGDVVVALNRLAMTIDELADLLSRCLAQFQSSRSGPA